MARSVIIDDPCRVCGGIGSLRSRSVMQPHQTCPRCNGECNEPPLFQWKTILFMVLIAVIGAYLVMGVK